MTEDATTEDIDAMDLQDAIDIVQRPSLPKARSRTNIVTERYTSRGRLFGPFTTTGEGTTQATYSLEGYRYFKVVNAIHRIALETGKDPVTDR